MNYLFLYLLETTEGQEGTPSAHQASDTRHRLHRKVLPSLARCCSQMSEENAWGKSNLSKWIYHPRTLEEVKSTRDLHVSNPTRNLLAQLQVYLTVDLIYNPNMPWHAPFHILKFNSFLGHNLPIPLPPPPHLLGIHLQRRITTGSFVFWIKLSPKMLKVYPQLNEIYFPASFIYFL